MLPDFAISTHLYHDDLLSRDHLVEIAAHEFETVEIFANAPHFDASNERLVDETRGHLEDTGLRVTAIHAPIADRLHGNRWGVAWSIASDEVRLRQQAVDAVAAAIRAGGRLGAATVVVHVGVPDSQQPAAGRNRPDAALRSLEALAAVAEASGVGLALEVMGNALSTPDALVRLLGEQTDWRHVGACLDVGHAFLLGDAVEAVETLSGHLVTTHVHDNHGRSDDHLVPFEGAIDWPAVLTAFQKVGYEGPFVFELRGTRDTRATLERARVARQRLEALVQDR